MKPKSFIYLHTFLPLLSLSGARSAATEEKKRFVLVPIRFASEAWPRPGLAEPRSASIADFGNTEPLSSTYRKGRLSRLRQAGQGTGFGTVLRP